MSGLSLAPNQTAALTLDFSNPIAISRLLDSTLLRADASEKDIVKLCEDAVQFAFATVFVHPSYAALAANLLRGSQVKLGVPVGFPFGANTTTLKRLEAEEMLLAGAQELDMVLNLGALKSRNRTRVQSDIAGVMEVARHGGAILKVILETPLLSVDEKILACELAVAAGADFVKTATGLCGGATVADVSLMRGVVGGRAGVKASGGIRMLADVISMVEAGATRIGTSTAVEIMRQLSALNR